jgi:holo-[acyl-carrier protein] synthase
VIIGVGCDIVEHQEIKELEWETDADVLNRFFSVKELVLYGTARHITFLAGRFAIKEAVLKCLGCGMIDGISLQEIQTLQLESGKLYLELSGDIEKLADEKCITSWHISITHSTNYSLAMVVGEGIT